jgi:hypothetical protein
MRSTDLEEGKRRAVGASVPSVYTGEVGNGTSDGGSTQQGTTAGPASRAVTLAYGGRCDH